MLFSFSLYHRTEVTLMLCIKSNLWWMNGKTRFQAHISFVCIFIYVRGKRVCVAVCGWKLSRIIRCVWIPFFSFVGFFFGSPFPFPSWHKLRCSRHTSNQTPNLWEEKQSREPKIILLLRLVEMDPIKCLCLYACAGFVFFLLLSCVCVAPLGMKERKREWDEQMVDLLLCWFGSLIALVVMVVWWHWSPDTFSSSSTFSRLYWKSMPDFFFKLSG